jgi:hypothetical protein
VNFEIEIAMKTTLKKIQDPRSKIQKSSKHQDPTEGEGLALVLTNTSPVGRVAPRPALCTLASRRALHVWSLVLVWCLVFGVWCFRASAELPAPDNLLYGTINIGSPITASHTNFVVEARRTINGPAIASYRMGSDTGVGNFYLLKLQLEELNPLDDPTNSSLASNSLFLVVRTDSGLQAQQPFVIPERGYAARLDFGTPVSDSDSDGLPDVWELFYFGNFGPTTNSTAANGETVLHNYLAGTDPNDPNAKFRLFITLTNHLRVVSFVAAKAQGPGYEGLNRYYTLDATPGFSPASWQLVPGYTNVLGDNQTVNHFPIGTNFSEFFHARISLRNP